jgi:hypothetical protein
LTPEKQERTRFLTSRAETSGGVQPSEG